jgi:hypothetical protein
MNLPDTSLTVSNKSSFELNRLVKNLQKKNYTPPVLEVICIETTAFTSGVGSDGVAYSS